MKYFTDAGIECTPGECKLIESLNRLAKKWEKDVKIPLLLFVES